jgi:pentatricopeptide repeat protein
MRRSIFAAARRPQVAREVLEMMAARGMTPNLRHYNAVMTAYIKNGLHNDALDVFHKMTMRDEYSYGIAVKAYDAVGRWEDVWALFEKLDGTAMINTVICNTVLHALGAAKQWSKVFSVYNRMVTSQPGGVKLSTHVYPDQYTAMSLLSLLQKDAQYDVVAYLQANCFPTISFAKTRSNSSSMSVSADVGAAPEPQQVFLPIPEEAYVALLRPSTESILRMASNVISSGSVVKGTVESVDVPATSAASSSAHDEPFFQVLDSIEAIGALHPTISEAGTLYEKLIENPNGSVVEILRMAGRIDEALEIIDRLHDKGKKANPSFYDAAIKACIPLGDGERALKIFAKMLAYDIPRSNVFYQHLISVLTVYGDNDALAYVQEKGKIDQMLL